MTLSLAYAGSALLALVACSWLGAHLGASLTSQQRAPAARGARARATATFKRRPQDHASLVPKAMTQPALNRRTQPPATVSSQHAVAIERIFGGNWVDHNVTSATLAVEHFQQTYWRRWEAALGLRFATHPLRTDDEANASYCVVGSPSCASREYWEALCPGKLIVKIDSVDADYGGYKPCRSAWGGTCGGSAAQSQRLLQGKNHASAPHPSHCAAPRCTSQIPCGNATRAWCTAIGDRMLRLVGSSPGLLRFTHLSACHFLSVPWLSHARSTRTLKGPQGPEEPSADGSAEGSGGQRPWMIAMAAGTGAHYYGGKIGWLVWRQHLDAACIQLGAKVCNRLKPSMRPSSYASTRQILELYAQSTFCVQPPGDMLARPGILDALSVGCIPVFLVADQQRLWPHFWEGSTASLLLPHYDAAWRRREAAMRISGSHEPYPNATEALLWLLSVPPANITRLRRNVRRAAAAMRYASRFPGDGDPDAFETLLCLIERVIGRGPSPTDHQNQGQRTRGHHQVHRSCSRAWLLARGRGTTVPRFKYIPCAGPACAHWNQTSCPLTPC
jgi:hypothetical protein